MARKPVQVNLGALLGKTPPQAIEAEAALLGSIILDSNVLDDVMGVLSAGSFYTPKHGVIYDALLQVHRDGGRGDMVRLNDVLTKRGVIDEVGGIDYLVELAESVPSATSAPHYAGIVQGKAMLRRLGEVAGEIIHDVYQHDGPAGELIDKAQRLVFDLSVAMETENPAHELAEVMNEVRDGLAEAAETGVKRGVPTGFRELDEMLDGGGFQPGQIVIVAARPSMGKTAWAINVAENMALNGYRVAAFSIEMGYRSLGKRIMASLSGVPGQLMRHPANMVADDWEAMDRAVMRAKDVPLTIMDTPSLSLDRLTSLSRKLVARQGVQAIIVDYLQIMDAPTRNTRNDEVSALSRGIKSLARSLNVPIVLLSQVSRKADDGGVNPGLPKMSHLRDSGAIEQDADTIIFLHRDDYYNIRHDPSHEPDGKAILNVAKQREGPTGNVPLRFDAERTHFSNWDGGEF